MRLQVICCAMGKNSPCLVLPFTGDNFEVLSSPTSDADEATTPSSDGPINETPEEREARLAELREELEKVLFFFNLLFCFSQESLYTNITDGLKWEKV